MAGRPTLELAFLSPVKGFQPSLVSAVNAVFPFRLQGASHALGHRQGGADACHLAVASIWCGPRASVC
jgi:hypothetical protein